MGEAEKKSLLCDPGPELPLVGREEKKGEENKSDGKKKNVGRGTIVALSFLLKVQ